MPELSDDGEKYGEECKREISREEGDVDGQTFTDMQLCEEKTEWENDRLRQHDAKGVKLVCCDIDKELQ